MLSIGQFAEMAQVSPRTVRYYESIGLLPKSSRGENNYRYYHQNWLPRLVRIRDLQSLGFSLDDIKVIISFTESELKERLQAKILEIGNEINKLEDRRDRIAKLLSVANKIDSGEVLTETERNLYMENMREEILKGLKDRYSELTPSMLSYYQRDTWIHSNPEVAEYLNAVKKCIQFARDKNLTLGPARGSAPASISLFSLGASGVDPLKHDMVPERLSTQAPFFHIDVEYGRGQEFVDFCREINKSLAYGSIQAFKMPLIEIVKNTHQAIGKDIDYESIDDNSDLVLAPFKNLDLEKIFQFDFSTDALIMNFERFLPEYEGLEKMKEHFQDQKDFNFRDILNLTALWRPHHKEIIARINLYREAKRKDFSYEFLSEKSKALLKPNYGVLVYHEELIKIISEYTGWDYARSNNLRRLCGNRKNTNQRDQDPDWVEFQTLVPKAIVNFVAEESKWAFCQPHAISFGKFTKQSAVLKTLHKKEYFQAIENFEQKYGFCWDDIGLNFKGVSMHQD